ncbi:MAG: zinc/iron-chelating domain-containing protein [Candidatus Contendobacter odensis]|uniref:Zinc/iron-chelating domain-containing protein n=1 Tax=Candidatus Contendibacter odensensis TaxID=1400860 RepID=A0A2G6PEP5_9GAMM|nr:MAG: zinc/iron-chelating domain-containing protein [Candidatus Contendobacter odensis]
MNTPKATDDYVLANIEFTITGKKLKLRMPVPAGQVQLGALLPFFQYLTDSFVDLSVENAQGQGSTVSCCKGCGACCRQLVPIAEIEARQLRQVVEDMPEPRKSTILARFEAAKQQLQAAGLLDRLRKPNQVDDNDVNTVGLDYFLQGIACPFLEDESCSIYEKRPLICREYLVVSPPEHCTSPAQETVHPVKLAVHTAKAVRGLNTSLSEYGNRWISLVLALEWASSHPDNSPRRPGTTWVQEALAHITGRELEGHSEGWIHRF